MLRVSWCRVTFMLEMKSDRARVRALAYSRPEAQAFRWKRFLLCDVGVSLFDIAMVFALPTFLRGAYGVFSLLWFRPISLARQLFRSLFSYIRESVSSEFFLCFTFDIFFHFFGGGQLSAHYYIFFPDANRNDNGFEICLWTRCA